MNFTSTPGRPAAMARLAAFSSIALHFIRYLRWRTFSRCRHVRNHLDVDGGRLSYHCFGRGIPVMLLHGGLSRPLSWFSQVPVLTNQGFQVILPATRGHGSSRNRRVEADYWTYAEDVRRICDHLALRKIHIVGWSDGGITGLHFALRYPQRVSRLVLISVNYHYRGIDMSRDSPARDDVWKSWLYRLWLGSGRQSGRLVKAVKRLWEIQPSLDLQALGAIDRPVLSITGEHDCVSIQHARELTETLPDSRHVEIPRGGHATPVTHAAEINRLTIGFLLAASERRSRAIA